LSFIEGRHRQYAPWIGIMSICLLPRASCILYSVLVVRISESPRRCQFQLVSRRVRRTYQHQGWTWSSSGRAYRKRCPARSVLQSQWQPSEVIIGPLLRASPQSTPSLRQSISSLGRENGSRCVTYVVAGEVVDCEC
jgi:hypothetical protein